MEQKILLSILILAHLLADFVFQSDWVAIKKREKISYLFRHAFWVILTYFISTSIFFSYRLVIIIFVISIAHFFINLCKIKLEKKEKIAEIHLFFLDQLLHFIVILAIYPFLGNIYIQNWAYNLYQSIITYYPIFLNIDLIYMFKFIIILSGYIFIWNPGSHIVEKTLNNYKIVKPDYKSGEIIINNQKQVANPGELIGKLERVLLLSFILSNNFLVISIIFTAKSVARFSNFKDKDFVNYYIIGTLISLLIAMGVGFLLNIII